jgi:hypothetical protein
MQINVKAVPALDRRVNEALAQYQAGESRDFGS